MKYFLLAILFYPFCCIAQDNIELKSGEVFNCKIISISNDEVVFIVDSINNRKISKYLVQSINYNKTVINPNNHLIADTSVLIEQNFIQKKDTFNISETDLTMAGIERKKALDNKLIALGVAGSASTISIISGNYSIAIVGFVGGCVFGIISLVHDYKSANYLISAGKIKKTTN